MTSSFCRYHGVTRADMQALSAASSYFLLDGDAWRISTNFAAENVLMDNDYLYDLGGPSRWIRTEDEYRRSRQKKNLKRNASKLLGIDI